MPIPVESKERSVVESPKNPIQERPEDIQIPPEIERAGVTPSKTQFTQQIKSDQGTPIIQTPQTQTVTIQIPTEEEKLETLAKGSPSDSSTWFAKFWKRVVKKAFHFGWKLVFGDNNQ